MTNERQSTRARSVFFNKTEKKIKYKHNNTTKVRSVVYIVLIMLFYLKLHDLSWFNLVLITT